MERGAVHSHGKPVEVEKPNYESCNYNSQPIGDVFEELLLPSGAQHSCSAAPNGGVSVLELASGSGQHAVYMTRRFSPSVIARWLCTDLPEMLPGISRWLQEDGKLHAGLVKQPLALNFTDPESQWLEARRISILPNVGYDIVFTANSFHIAPWDACRVLMQRLPLVLRPGGIFLVYGAFNYNGTFTTESNRRFDGYLKQRDPRSGIRCKEVVESFLVQQGFSLQKDYEMPCNNRCLCFRYQGREKADTQ